MITGAALLWLTLNVYHEARGESDRVQIAVAHVTINRAEQQDKHLPEVVKARKQFSWTNNRTKRNSKPWKDDPQVFLNCSINTLRAITREDSTSGATHYHETTVKPKWSKKMKKIRVLGPFILLKEKK